jgi:hypothetical protein
VPLAVISLGRMAYSGSTTPAQRLIDRLDRERHVLALAADEAAQVEAAEAAQVVRV